MKNMADSLELTTNGGARDAANSSVKDELRWAVSTGADPKKTKGGWGMFLLGITGLLLCAIAVAPGSYERLSAPTTVHAVSQHETVRVSWDADQTFDVAFVVRDDVTHEVVCRSYQSPSCAFFSQPGSWRFSVQARWHHTHSKWSKPSRLVEVPGPSL